MQVRRKIDKAFAVIDRFSEKQQPALRARCLEIKQAQHVLNQVAEPYFKQCMQSCRGLCCRNIYVGDMVTLLDYIFILVLDSDLSARMYEYSGKEGLFSADCIFLHNGTGPCIFNAAMKPERCIITFCSNTGPIHREIRAVRKKFSALQRFIFFRKPTAFL